jgi:hypothetical protein
MPHPLDITFLVEDEQMPRWAARQIAANVKARDGQQCRVAVTAEKGTPKQRGTYFLFLSWISAAYHDRGEDMPKELLHRWYKIRFLPVVAGTIERETGEVVKVEETYRYPDKSEETVYTTRHLTKEAYALYIDMIASDDDVLAMNVPVPSIEGIRSGRIEEPYEA